MAAVRYFKTNSVHLAFVAWSFLSHDPWETTVSTYSENEHLEQHLQKVLQKQHRSFLAASGSKSFKFLKISWGTVQPKLGTIARFSGMSDETLSVTI